MSTYPGGDATGDATFRIPREDPVAAECTSLSCELSGIVTDPGFVALVVVAGLVAFVAFAYIRDAKECCREERRRVIDERDAFEEFSDRVASFDPAPVNAATAFDGPVVGVQRGAGFGAPGDVRLQRVVDAYENTVMSLPHYQREYDETVGESLAAELGPDATMTLSNGEALSPELQSALISRSRHAATSRSELAEAIDVELDALSDAEARATDIDRSRRRLLEHLDGIPKRRRTDALIDVFDRLEGLEAKCDDAATTRQRAIRDPPMSVDFASSAGSTPTFYNYLYGPLDDTNHPILAEFSALADRIRRDKDRIVGQIARG